MALRNLLRRRSEHVDEVCAGKHVGGSEGGSGWGGGAQRGYMETKHSRLGLENERTVNKSAGKRKNRGRLRVQ